MARIEYRLWSHMSHCSIDWLTAAMATQNCACAHGFDPSSVSLHSTLLSCILLPFHANSLFIPFFILLPILHPVRANSSPDAHFVSIFLFIEEDFLWIWISPPPPMCSFECVPNPFFPSFFLPSLLPSIWIFVTVAQCYDVPCIVLYHNIGPSNFRYATSTTRISSVTTRLRWSFRCVSAHCALKRSPNASLANGPRDYCRSGPSFPVSAPRWPIWRGWVGPVETALLDRRRRTRRRPRRRRAAAMPRICSRGVEKSLENPRKCAFPWSTPAAWVAWRRKAPRRWCSLTLVDEKQPGNVKPLSLGRLIDWLIVRSISWLILCSNAWLIDCLIDWLIVWMNVWLFVWMND